LGSQLQALISQGKLLALCLQLAEYLGDFEFALLETCFESQNLLLLLVVFGCFYQARRVLGDAAEELFLGDLFDITES
jgi:hypothetical protein